MTREWVSEQDHRWVMVCDQAGCETRSEAFPNQPDLGIFQGRGWFIAKKWGDVCPSCLASGAEPTGPAHRPFPARPEEPQCQEIKP